MATWKKVILAGDQENLGGSDLTSSDPTRTFTLASSGTFYIKGSDNIIHFEINRTASRS